MRKPGLIAAAFALALWSHVAKAGPGAAEQFQASITSPPLLRAFLYRMPKGGDLHVHLSGAAYAEVLIRSAVAADLCVNSVTMKIARAPCASLNRRIAEARDDPALYQAIIDRWSMRDFVRLTGANGHDHFFATFGLFGDAASQGEMAADVVDRAGFDTMA